MLVPGSIPSIIFSFVIDTGRMGKYSNLLLGALRPLLGAKSSEHKTTSKAIRNWAWLLKPILSLAALYYILHRLEGVDMSLFLGTFTNRSLSIPIWIVAIILSVILMLMNWGIEVVKWHMLIHPVYNTKITTSIKAVLTGATTGIFTPNRLGEFVGRTLALKPENRVGGTLLSVVNGLAQTVATFSFGILGFILLINLRGSEVFGDFGSISLQVLLIGCWLIALFIFFRFKVLTDLLKGVNLFGRPLSKYLETYENVDESVLQRLYGLSVVRFITFILQYFLVFYLLSPDPAWIDISGASMLTLFSTTILAFLPMPDLLLRQSLALSYFQLFAFDSLIVTQVVLLVWVVNVALPAAIGAFVLFTYRIYRNRK